MLGVELILADPMVTSNIVEPRWVYGSSGNNRFSNELLKQVTFSINTSVIATLKRPLKPSFLVLDY
jgi:hypothetical protein